MEGQRGMERVTGDGEMRTNLAHAEVAIHEEDGEEAL